MEWDDLNYWNTGEWQVIEEKLDDEEGIKTLPDGKRIVVDKTKVWGFNPKRENIFAALDATPFERVRVVILGQDPYPTSEHATGLAFSIPSSVHSNKWPKTLNNIITEYKSDLGISLWPKSGDLSPWAESGVLLFNTVPTVQSGKPGSHASWPEWAPLVEEIIETLIHRGNVVFSAWGAKAGMAVRKAENSKSCRVHRCVHPSPLSANRGWFGSRPFSTANTYLKELGVEPIDWRLP